MKYTVSESTPSASKLSSLTFSSEEELFRSIFECLDIAIVLVNSDGDILQANRAFYSLTQSHCNLLTSSFSLFDFLVPKAHKKVSELLTAALTETKQMAQMETCLVDAENAVHDICLSLSRVDGFCGFALTIRELSESKHAHAELKHRADDLENLFYLILHNLKSPAVSIQGFVKLLLEEGSSVSASEIRRYLQRIGKNAERMNVMLQDLVAFAKFSRNGLGKNKVPLPEVLESIRAECFFMIKEKGIDFRIPRHLPVISADFDGIFTVFYNLIENSIKYVGGTQEPVVEIGWEEKHRFILFWVKDNCPGVNEKYHEKIFDLFERAAAPKNIEGTGVGLAIVRRIVERHGGCVRFVSRPNAGTVVYFTLPKLML